MYWKEQMKFHIKKNCYKFANSFFWTKIMLGLKRKLLLSSLVTVLILKYEAELLWKECYQSGTLKAKFCI